jgi:lon-related putative ATP-dependent protease
MPVAQELPVEALRRACDPDTFTFETTADLPPLAEVLGQPRAVAALEFGLAIASHGFNLFALGQPGSGRTTLIRQHVERHAAAQPVPPDLCFVFNFADARRPKPLHLPAGRAAQFKKDVAGLVEELRTIIPKAFDTPEYGTRRDAIGASLDADRQRIYETMEAFVGTSGFQLVKGPSGLLLVPAPGGKIIPEEELEKLSGEDRERITRARAKVQKEIETSLRAAREAEKRARAALRELDNETAAYAARHAVDDLRARYADLPDVLAYLDTLQADVIAHADDFRPDKEGEKPQNPLAALVAAMPDRTFTRYEVNVMVDNGQLKGAPVIIESNPTYHNLTGRIEHHVLLNEVHTDHTMIKPGALHRANGGYLLLPARECLMLPYAWEALKRCLRTRELDVEELGTQLSLISTVTLDPEAVPLDVKVVLIGSPALYYLLAAYDEDFQKLFKVRAEFAARMMRTADSERSYALFVNAIAHAENTLPFDRSAVARIIEFGSRLAGDQNWLTTRFGEIADLVREAAHRAASNSHQAVTVDDIRATEEACRFRANLIEEHIQEMMAEGIILLDIEGTAVGRLNGLTVVGLGDYQFGHPARITATVSPGRGGVVSIEREVELSGPIHGKGVLILSGYLLRQYGQTGPLSLSASLVFEQTYATVDGDSASLAELCVLLSALSGIPLRQDIAVTGSVNQHGQVQPVGGVTEKVEGFFDLCKTRGFTGSQGVLLPATNRRNLNLRDDVLDAVRQGRFHLWTAATVDEALQLLTGQSEDEVHAAVAGKLEQYAEILKRAGPERGVTSPSPGAPE